jgi:STE24 endopeptidase
MCPRLRSPVLSVVLGVLAALFVILPLRLARADVLPPTDAAPPVPSAIAVTVKPLVPLGPIPAAATGRPFDAEAATKAYLDAIPAADHAKSDAYFEGGYWLILVGFLETTAISLLLLRLGWSAKMRDRARSISRIGFVQTALYWLQYVVVVAVLGFPLGIYTDFVREHAYGLSNMTFGAWLGDSMKAFALILVVGSLVIPALYAVVARAKQTWWLWGSAVLLVFAALGGLVAPVFIAPLFNHYATVTRDEIRGPILSLARANGIAADEVWEFDASRQSNRVSANVSGLFGTERISLNDNLLARCSLPEIKAVMGHEMGHYVLHHVVKGLVDIGILLVLGFAFVRFGFERLRSRFGARWRVEGIDDPAGLPLVVFLIGFYSFLLTPVTNTLTRSGEAEADIFGVNASREPDGMAQVAIKLGEYRKLDPGPIEEFVFFDHPSGHSRILMAMRWKGEHL